VVRPGAGSGDCTGAVVRGVGVGAGGGVSVRVSVSGGVSDSDSDSDSDGVRVGGGVERSCARRFANVACDAAATQACEAGTDASEHSRQFRPPMRALAATLALVAASTFVAASAFADDEAASTELFNAGRDLMKKGDYGAACPKLAESVRLKATVGGLAKLAECEEHEKRLVSAYTRWQQALNLARATSDDRAPVVQRELDRIDKVVPKLVVKAASALPAEAAIRVDDTTLGAASLGVPLPVEPGAHTVQASAQGKKPWSTTVTAAADGATTSVVVPSLEDAPVTPPTTPAVAPAPVPSPISPMAPTPPLPAPPSTHPSSPWPTVGLFVGVAGLASIGAGAALGFVAMSKRNEANCPGNTCPDASSAATLGDAKTAADWSTGLFVAGGVLAASGVTLWLVWREHSTPTAQVGAVPLPGGVALVGSWR
jgi:hypothetical protein